jgi:glycosyltransferase involved in cell wall biosynthesis
MNPGNKGGLQLRGFTKKSLAGKPLITVITVTYNEYKTIEKTIKSVIDQTYDNVEFIIIDGGSSDGTVDVLKNYNDNIDYWISEKDNGVYDAINKAIRISNGDWILVLGSNDAFYEKTTLAQIAPYLLHSNYVYYGDVYCPSRKITYGGRFNTFRLFYENIPHQGLFYPRNIFKRYQYNLNYKICADYDLAIRCFFDRDYKFKHIPCIIAEYADDGGLSKTMADEKFAKTKNNIIKDSAPLIIWLVYRLIRIARFALRNRWLSSK